MDNTLLKGIWKYTLPVPSFIWQKKIYEKAGQAGKLIQFMTKEHHQVRNFVVQTLPETGEPLSLKTIAEKLNIPFERVLKIVNELEKHKFFLFRNQHGDITWAYPVTVEKTPHQVIFSTGEHINAA
ncbi:MAG: hypothetical protein KKE44_22025 [Proteobacteria bacterium]|nr:hypothetical protein [Pseudomonadota bacterium]MBU1585413.1 hypothetical protein [Pseudomonadota bacterium]MBU2455465.1 hypothetical protein [Pseudomonadota bacterium]MBU2627474.1 hypothetical protein [Pseudomonadota bacterium]